MRRIVVPWLVLALGMVLTVVCTAYVSVIARSEAQQRFNHACEVVEGDIRDRMERYISLLRGGAGLFAASDSVTFEDFRRFVERLELPEQYPGIQGIGYAARVRDSDFEHFTNRMRAQLGPEFHIWPAGSRPEYYPIVYLQPLDRRNQAAIGYDMYAEPVRREAMQRAARTAVAAASGRVTLVQEIDRVKQPGFLIYVPIYRTGNVPERPEQREQELIGFVYSPYRARDLLEAIFSRQTRPHVQLRIYDGAIDEASLLYDSAASSEDLPPPSFENMRSFNLAGRSWILSFSSRPEFDATAGSTLNVLVFATGFVMSLLLFALTWGQARARESAERVAGELRRSQDAIRAGEAQARAGQHAQLRFARQMALRGDVSIALTQSTRSIDEFLQACAEAIVRHLDVVTACIWLLDVEGGWLELKARAGTSPEPDGSLSRIRLGEPGIGSIAEQGEPVLTNSLASDTSIIDPEWARREGVVGFAGYPLRVENRVIGVVAKFTRHPLDGESLESLATVADLAAQGVERRRAEVALARYREHLEQLVRERTDQLEASQERLRRSERLASLGTFSTGIAHEINNPLNAILMSAQFALAEENDAEWASSAREALRVIEIEAKRCGRIVRNVLQFARAGRSQRSPQNLNELVRRSVERARQYVGEEQLDVCLELSEPLPQLMLDPTQLEQVIVNLVQNAVDAAGSHVRVTLATQVLDGEVQLSVADNGPGIPAELIPHIFDPFFSTRREKGGTGLGLSMVHGIITEHSGWIDVESTPGHGALFRIHFPITVERGDE